MELLEAETKSGLGRKKTFRVRETPEVTWLFNVFVFNQQIITFLEAKNGYHIFVHF